MARDSPLMPGSVLPKSKIRKREEDWRADWFYTAVGDHPRLGLLTGSPVTQENWVERPRIGREFDGVMERLDHLRQAGLSSHAVFRDFMSQRISPLQARERPAWFYFGVPTACGRSWGRSTIWTRTPLGW
uniref:Uncharacterized protein n=1 Tax=Leersia perrieri TaxID=77586 RepID=A0A0D9XDF7_9ORYZ